MIIYVQDLDHYHNGVYLNLLEEYLPCIEVYKIYIIYSRSLGFAVPFLLAIFF